MALLAHCWLLVGTFIVPHGGFFSKWFHLTFYIHPFFLFFYLFFFFFRKLLLFLYFPVSLVVCFTVSFVSRCFPASSVDPKEVFFVAMAEDSETVQDSQVVEVVSGIVKQGCLDWVGELDQDSFVATTLESWLNEYLCSDRYVDPYLSSYGVDRDESESPLLPLTDDEQLDCSSENSCDHRLVEGSNNDTDDRYVLSDDAMVACDSPVRALVQNPITQNVGKGKDSFNQKLAERLRFFNLLYQERLQGFRAISNDEFCIIPSLSENTGLSMQQIRASRQGILKSLESDFELIYVAEISLHFEALHHQYRQVKIRTVSGNAQNRLFHHNILRKFQELQILLERFVEEEKPGSDYIPERLSFHYTIQIPDVHEFALDESVSHIGSEAIRSKMVLKAIKECIKAYWSYIKTENKESIWRYRGGIRRTHAPVEDPVDLELLYDVNTTLRKKGIMMKDLQGKRRCWVRRRVEPLQTEDDKTDLLLAMIDMKLVQRVLKMSLVSGSQLRWCREKLNSLEFRQGRVFRSPAGQLFPCS